MPYFSPDGKRIAFVSNRAGTNDIWVMNADGSGAVNLTPTPGVTEFTPSFSPDGRRVAYTHRT